MRINKKSEIIITNNLINIYVVKWFETKLFYIPNIWIISIFIYNNIYTWTSYFIEYLKGKCWVTVCWMNGYMNMILNQKQ